MGASWDWNGWACMLNQARRQRTRDRIAEDRAAAR
jgi:hypothetical protein